METFISYYESPLGRLRIAATDSYVRSVEFVGDAAGPASLSSMGASCRAQLDEYFAGSRKTFDLPLQQEGTPFQQKVWKLLQDIPYGKTFSYQHLARQYGDLKAIRAVAAANGRNALAIIIPCHRVIGTNGTLTGYAGGLWRKQWLLQHEAKHHLGVVELFG